jgi:hypothetical protein
VNLLPVPMAVDGFEIEVRDAATGVTIGKGVTLGVESRWLDPQESVLFRVQLQEGLGEGATTELFKGERNCDIEGRVTIGIGSGRADVGVQVRRVVGLTIEA